MPMLKQVTYISSSKGLLSEDQLIELLDNARTANQYHEITGLLLYSNGSIIQVIEGEPGNVNRLYRNIRRDTRHTGVITLQDEQISSRYFSKWSMGYKNISSENIEGISDFFEKNQSEDEKKIISGQAKKLLLSFREKNL